jgi:MoxR-like ATPase
MSADGLSGASTPDGTGQHSSLPDDSADRNRPAWWIYRGTGRPLQDIELRKLLPPPPPWRNFTGQPLQPSPPHDDEDLERKLGPVSGPQPRHADRREVDAVNAVLYLRRPLLVTGKPGVGKSSLAYRISRELRLGRVLRWPISSRSTLREGLFEYDAIGRAQDAAAVRGTVGNGDVPDPPAGTGIGEYLQLGPLGTALLPYEVPRVLLIDELDKSDIDLPNDLLDVFEEGVYRIPELVRVRAREPHVRVHTADPEEMATIHGGQVRCRAFPLIIITSNGEREFPPAFLRRCLRFTMHEPDENNLADMVTAHFKNSPDERATVMIRNFLEYREVHSGLAADQLLNAVFLATSGAQTLDSSWEKLLDLVWQRLSAEAAPE